MKMEVGGFISVRFVTQRLKWLLVGINGFPCPAAIVPCCEVDRDFLICGLFGDMATDGGIEWIWFGVLGLLFCGGLRHAKRTD